MNSLQKISKILCLVGSGENLAQHDDLNNAHSQAVFKKSFKFYVGEPTEFEQNEESYKLNLAEQEKSKAGHYQTNFFIKKEALIKKSEILIKLPLSCHITNNKISIPQQEMRRIMFEFKRLSQQEESEQSDESDMSDRSELARGRGRPKGSKNKKNGEESSDESYSDLKKDEKKTSKGRPKGSRNKKKDVFEDEIFYETNFSIIFKKILQIRTPEEINKRLNKQSQKQKQQEKQQQNQEYINGKRTRGRPKGVKNKKTKMEDECDSEQNISMDPLPERQPLKGVHKCCSKCEVRENKRLFMQGKLKDRSLLKNLSQNIGIEDTTNVIISTIKNNQQNALKQLLSFVKNIQNEFLVPWDCAHRLEHAGYTVRTRKEYLIKYKKQMINALLQDQYAFKGNWWQIIGVDRLMENIPHFQAGIQIYGILTSAFPELIEVFNQNIPSLVRSGNQIISRFLIFKVLPLEQNSTIYGYSKDHLQCLNKKKNELQFKKSIMLKQNCTSNFCSPIHCAVINQNTDLLYYILKHISEFNVGDSLGRKPIHYAAVLESTKAIEILHKHNSEQLTQMDKKKMTPLMLAAQFGRYNVLKFLLQRVRDKQYTNHRCDAGLSALHYAIINQHQQCISILLDDPLVSIQQQTKERFSILHLAAGIGNKEIVKMILMKDNKIRWDNFRRSPLVFALRNHHNDIFFSILNETGCSLRRDHSNNTLLHYAAAYGNLELVQYLSNVMQQIPNKKNFYPWEIAVLKGHFLCAQNLERQNSSDFPHNHHLIFLLLKNPRGTKQFINMINYLLKMKVYSLDYQYSNVGDTCLHLICSISQKEYYDQRKRQTSQILPNEYQQMQKVLIILLLENGANPNITNQRGQKPVNLCIDNENSVGIQLLLEEIPFDIQPQTKNNHFVYYLSNIACKGKNEITFVYDKLSQVDQKILRIELRKTDCFGFQFLVFLIKNFTQTVHSNFKQNYLNQLEKFTIKERNLPETKKKCMIFAYQQYVEHEANLLKLVNFLVEKGADPRSIVTQPKVEHENQNYKKWGIQHFLMRFPSLVLLKAFMKWIDKNFNMQNSEGRTPLHLFCMWNHQGSLFNFTHPSSQQQSHSIPHIDFKLSNDYDGQASLEYLLENGLTSNILDINRSTPLLYAALSGQLKYMNMLRHYGSSINNCNLLNQVPLIQIIKAKSKFTVEQIGSILEDNGAQADIKDIDDRNALHHLVSNSTNFDTSPEIFNKLLSYGVKINSIDKYGRSPIFYCFIKIKADEQQQDNELERSNDKVEILQTLLNCQEIDLNILDVFNKTPLHYACQKKFFFSILYLLDKNINYDIKDSQGNTPLAICLRHQMLNQAALLIRKGVKYGQVFEDGHSFSYFQYAVTKLSVGICFMLLDHGYPLQKALEEVDNEAFKRQLRKKYIQVN